MRSLSETKPYYPALAFALLVSLTLSGCMTYNGTRRTYLERMTEYLPEPSRPVIVIPGFGNSRLYNVETGESVWGHGKNLVHTKYEDDLDLPVDPDTGMFGRDNLVPDGGFAGSRAPFNIAFTLRSALRNFGRYADGNEDPDNVGAVYAFAYDWRLSATTNARLLDEFIDSIRAHHGANPPQVDLVAHSAGGLIALAYLHLGGLEADADPDQIAAASRRAVDKVASVTLIGVPQRGTNEVVRALTRGDKLVRRELPPSMMASFPSIPEMLPEDGMIFIDEQGRKVDFDIWDPAAWKAYGFAIWSKNPSPEVQEAFEGSFERARKVREMLGRPLPQGVREHVIVSDCVPTAGRVLLRSDRSLAFYPTELKDEERALGKIMFVPGDGSIEAQSALGRSQSASIFCAGHHGMAGDPSVHRTLIRGLVENGLEAKAGTDPEASLATAASMETPNPRW